MVLLLTILPSPVTNSALGTVTVSGDGKLEGFTNDGTVNIPTPGRLTFAGPIVNHGDINLISTGSFGQLRIDGIVTLTGGWNNYNVRFCSQHDF